MAAVFNLSQLNGSRLADWKPEHDRPGSRRPAPPPPALIIPTEEKTSMGIRDELRDAIRAKPGITMEELKAKFPDQDISISLSQMSLEGQLKRKGKGREAAYSIGRERQAAKAPRRTAGKRASPKPRAPKLQPLTRGNHIDGAIVELRQRIEGLEQAITVLEALS